MHEFVIKKGLIVESGSVQITGSVSATDTITANSFAINQTAGWSGTIMIPTNPPITITVEGGIITNAT